MKTFGGIFLLLAGFSGFLLAILHLAIIIMGRKGYGYFGAAQFIPLVEKGSPWPAIITFLLAAIFALCGSYAFSGADLLPRFPLLRIGLFVIGSVFTLRGLALVREIPLYLRGEALMPGREIIFSTVSLTVGLLYLAGLVLRWSDLA